MSMPHQPPPQGGFGAPGPYAAQQPPFPQQQAYGQPPYGVPPNGPVGPGGWGPPPPPPQRKNRTALVVVLIVAGLLLLGYLAKIGKEVQTRGAGPDSSYPVAEYRLELTETLLDGTYSLTQDLSTAGPQDDGSWNRSDLKDFKPVVGQYTGKGGAASGEVLVVSGMYARIKDPDAVRAGMLRGAEDGQGATLAVPPRDITPKGSDLVVSCQVLTVDQAGGTTTMPLCAWADDNTAASVGEITKEIAVQDPASVDLEAAAARALDVREEMRQPLN
ncbi:hypothetical protein [Streptomyces apocyni]|uniref:hypothetical protein n=1 Tax=Streptomyces apocyni TaxID=2654677 RepID=UPI0012EAC738|nr:hypothetical protein [Streptomyces apocyni]